MHRQHLLSLLQDYRQTYPGELGLVERYAGFVQSHPDCFERGLMTGHVTGSAWLVNRPGTHVLLTHHRKLKRWLQLGGHADGEGDVLKVALTEAREESGLERLVAVAPALFDLDIHRIPEHGSEPAHYHYDARFALRSMDDSPYRISGESNQLAWAEIANLGAYTNEESMLKMARKWLALPPPVQCG